MSSECDKVFVRAMVECLWFLSFFMYVPWMAGETPSSVDKLEFRQKDFDDSDAAVLVTFLKYEAEDLGITIDTQTGVCCAKSLTPRESLQSVKWKDKGKKERGLDVLKNFFTAKSSGPCKLNTSFGNLSASSLAEVDWKGVFSVCLLSGCKK